MSRRIPPSVFPATVIPIKSSSILNTSLAAWQTADRPTPWVFSSVPSTSNNKSFISSSSNFSLTFHSRPGPHVQSPKQHDLRGLDTVLSAGCMQLQEPHEI